jgi:OmpA-OmpF porin, OOP family
MQLRSLLAFTFIALSGAAGAAQTAAGDAGRGGGAGGQSWLPYTSYGYVGGALGRVDYDQDDCLLFCDDRATGLKLFTGGQINNYLGLELSYVHFGEADPGNVDLKAQGLNLSVLGHLPISNQFKVFGKLGTIYAFTRTRAPAGRPSGHHDGFGWSFGAGLQYDINRNWAVRGDWDRYRLKFAGQRNYSDFYSVGAVYKF